MNSIPAIYVNGVFQPTAPVALPENTPVTVLLAAAAAPEVPLGCPGEKLHDILSRSYDDTEETGATIGSNSDELYALLESRFESGFTDTAARVDELDP